MADQSDCRSCGRVADVNDGYFASAERVIRRDFGFEPALDHLASLDLCQACGPREASGAAHTD
jgi:hypothetical protein